MEALQRYCSLPDYWRLCCKTCNSINSTKAEPNSTGTSTLNSNVTPTPAKNHLSSILTTAQPTKAAISTTSTDTTTQLPASKTLTLFSTESSTRTTKIISRHKLVATSIPFLPTAFFRSVSTSTATRSQVSSTKTLHFTSTSLRTRKIIPTYPLAATSFPFLSTTIPNTFSTSATNNFPASTTQPLHFTSSSPSTTRVIPTHPPATTRISFLSTFFPTTITSFTTSHHNAEITDPLLQSTLTPSTAKTTSANVLTPKSTHITRGSTENCTKIVIRPKFNPKKKIKPQIKKELVPSKGNLKKEIAQRNTTKKYVPPRNNLQKMTSINKKNGAPKKIIVTNSNGKKPTPTNTAPKKTSPSTLTPKKTTPKNTPPKKTISSKTIVKKTNPPSTCAKKNILPNPTVKKTTPAKNTPKKTIPSNPTAKKTTPLNNTPKTTIPLKTNVKKSNATNTSPKQNILAHPTVKKKIPANITPKKTIPSNPTAKKIPINNAPNKTFTSRPTVKTSTPANTIPRTAIPSKTIVKKANPPFTSAKNASTLNTTPKNTSPVNNPPRKKTPINISKKTALVKKFPEKKTKPVPKKEVHLRTSPPKNTQPKKIITKQPQTKTNLKNNPKQAPKSAVKLKVNVKKNKVTEIKTNRKNKTSYFTTPPTPTEVFSSTSPSSSVVQVTVVSLPSSESKLSPIYISRDAMVTNRTPLIHHGGTDIGTTPGPIDDFITPSDEAVTGTIPYSESTVTSIGEDTETIWTFPSGDDIKESYSSSRGITDTVVLEDSLSMMIPTINGEDTTSPPWLDLPEYISVGVPIPTMTSDLPGTPVPTVESHTKEEQVTVTPEIISTLKPQQNVAEYNERNSIDVFDNRVVGVDGDVSQNNLIPKHRVSLREQTKNKRIQELLEEKRNFVLRMKRGHTEQ